MARDLMLTSDEYMALMRLIGSERESEGSALALSQDTEAKPKRRRSKSARSSDKKLSKAFEQANANLRKQNGDLKKGKTQADVARMAQKLRKKM